MNDGQPMSDEQKARLLSDAAQHERNAQDYARRAKRTQDMLDANPNAPERDKWLLSWKADMKRSRDSSESARRLTIMALQGYRRWSDVPMGARGTPEKGDV